ncbi:MAG: AAA family ATPase [Clostridia bacterium]|nr:AAA family ATPase [Clostridia bacterium]
MYLKYIQIVNYKNLKSSVFKFDKGANTIIGENDSGKSNAMTAIRVLLDSTFFYNTKRLKESDFSDSLGDWRGHWIIVSAFFDEITDDDKTNEICAEIIPSEENQNFLKSFIRCEDNNYGTVTLFIRPIKKIRNDLHKAKTKEEFERIRAGISLTDYEFFYTSRSQADYTNPEIYNALVGDLEQGEYVDPEKIDYEIMGNRIDILSVWQHVSLVFIDALRDVESELRKPRNPIRRVFDTIQKDVANESKDSITQKIQELNQIISSIPQISNIGKEVNGKLNEIAGLVYSPEIKVESKLKESIDSLAKYLAVSPSNQDDVDSLGLGHLNILYIALKLVEFEYNRNHEILNIMIIEEPEAHIHTHIQKTLFDNLKVAKDYTQVIMTTHSNQISEVSDITKVNVLKINNSITEVMYPSAGLDDFGFDRLKQKEFPLSLCLERYLDAKRSVLLFSKGVILVEGDGEEILLPSLVKNIFGVSLDELGIGLINVGSVGFENIASIFSPQRLRRHCAIVTDLDAVVAGAKKSNEEAAKRGETRKEKLNDLFSDNPWVEMFYAPYTFEVDFAAIQENREFIKTIIQSHYEKQYAIEKHTSHLFGSDAERYDSVLTLAKAIGKGWYATLLASEINGSAILPQYLLKSIVFASQDVLSFTILWKIFSYRLSCYEDAEFEELRDQVKHTVELEEKTKIIDSFVEDYPSDMFSQLVINRRELLNG